MAALPRPELPAGPQRDLVDELHELHHQAGWPSLRTIGRAVGCSPTTVSAAFSSARLPGWGLLELIAEFLQGDTARFHRLWLEAGTAAAGDRATPAPVGRSVELAAVRRLLASGTGLLVVTGEDGIGKSHLLAAAVPPADARTACAACLPLSRAAPLMPVVDALHAAWRTHDDSIAEETQTWWLRIRRLPDTAVLPLHPLNRDETADRAAELVDLVGVRRSLSHDPLGPAGVTADRFAACSQWDAELGRLAGRTQPEAWTVAAGRWDALARPHDAAYCRWRGAQAALAAGHGTAARRLLRQAALDARGHVPFTLALRATATAPA